MAGMNQRAPLIAFIPLLSFAISMQAQQTGRPVAHEQSSFSTEEAPGVPLVKRPVPIPHSVLRILETDDHVTSCLEGEDNSPTREHPLASWFLASEIHLDGPNETDLIILPSSDATSHYMCFHYVEGAGWFWVFRKNDKGYQLVLKAPGHGLNVIPTKYKGYRNIETGSLAQAGRFITTVTFRFDGKRYQEYQRATRESR
jgi:hypothetical protein